MTHWSRFDATADRRLLKKLTDDGESALVEVYDIYAERLYDYALLFTSDVHVARGIVHDALIDASRRAPRMRDRRHLRAWLYGAVRRRGLSQPRDAWTPPPGPSGAALGALDRTHRDALCLAYRHDMDGAALATTLGVSQRRARHRVSRATTRAESVTSTADDTPRGETARRETDGRDAAGREAGGREAEFRGRRVRERTPGDEAADPEAVFAARRIHQGAVPGRSVDEPAAREAALHGRPARRGAAVAHGLSGSPTSAADAPGEHEQRSREDAGASHAEADAPAGREGQDPYGPGAGTYDGVRTLASPAPPGADGHGPEAGVSGGEPGVDAAGGDVASGVEIARGLPAGAPPEALRDRVLHTVSDPQLARYRSQIVSRGGRLIASGFPRQPDAPSQVARRYAVGGVAMAAFVAVMGVGLNMIGGSARPPAIGGPVPSWTTTPGTAQPSAPRNTPSPGASAPGNGDRRPAALPTGRSRHGENGKRHSSDPSRQGGMRSPGPHPTAGGSDPPGKARPSVPPLPGDGILSVRPAKIGFGTSDSTASLVLTAAEGPVTWSADSASSAVSLSATHGTIARGGSLRVKVHLARNAILQLPGKTTITVTGTGGERTVPVSWSISLLSR